MSMTLTPGTPGNAIVLPMQSRDNRDRQALFRSYDATQKPQEFAG